MQNHSALLDQEKQFEICGFERFFCSLETSAEDKTELMKSLFIRPENVLNLAKSHVIFL